MPGQTVSAGLARKLEDKQRERQIEFASVYRTSRYKPVLNLIRISETLWFQRELNVDSQTTFLKELPHYIYAVIRGLWNM